MNIGRRRVRKTMPSYSEELESERLVFVVSRYLLAEILSKTKADVLSLQPQNLASKEVLRNLLLQEMGGELNSVKKSRQSITPRSNGSVGIVVATGKSLIEVRAPVESVF